MKEEQVREIVARGLDHLEAGRAGEAAECFGQARALDPSSPECAAYAAWAEYLRAPAAARKEAAQTSLTQLRRLASTHKSFALGHLLSARIQAQEGDPRAARRALGVALAMDPSFAEARVELNLLLEEERSSLARTAEEERQARQPAPKGWFRLRRSLWVLRAFLAVFVLGAFSYTGYYLWSEFLKEPQRGIGAEVFKDLFRLEDIRAIEGNLEAILIEPEALGMVERTRRLEQLCRRMMEEGFVAALFSDPAGKPTARCTRGLPSPVQPSP